MSSTLNQTEMMRQANQIVDFMTSDGKTTSEIEQALVANGTSPEIITTVMYQMPIVATHINATGILPNDSQPISNSRSSVWLERHETEMMNHANQIIETMRVDGKTDEEIEQELRTKGITVAVIKAALYKMPLTISTSTLKQQTVNSQQPFMPTPRSLSQSEMIRKAHSTVDFMQRDGKTDGEIEQALLSAGVSVDVIKSVLYKMSPNGFKQYTRQAPTSAYNASDDLLIGGFICIAGIVITIATYSAAARGGTYIVAWGAIIYGARRFIRGMNNQA